MTKENYQKIMEWDVPYGTFPCWFISEEDKQLSLKENKPFNKQRPICYFKQTEQLENNYIKGYIGHINLDGDFHENISTEYTYFENNQKRIPVYFSFDKVSIYRLIEVYTSNPLIFTLKRIDNPKAIKANTAFMIMPFKNPDLNAFYKNHIKEFLEENMKIQVFRADDFNGNDIIIDTIYNQIEKAEFIIVDTTIENKNVFYEFGYAAAKEKEIITIQNKGLEKSLFFDRIHIRAILYSSDNLDDFKKQLKNTIVAIRDKVTAKN